MITTTKALQLIRERMKVTLELADEYDRAGEHKQASDMRGIARCEDLEMVHFFHCQECEQAYPCDEESDEGFCQKCQAELNEDFEAYIEARNKEERARYAESYEHVTKTRI